tara:strand:- start:265 stop:450 length:186 start_codon:yes stop_codon:yes gene_type:complete
MKFLRNKMKIVLGRLMEEGLLEACQFLTEDRRYAPTVYNCKSAYWYWFKIRGPVKANNISS